MESEGSAKPDSTSQSSSTHVCWLLRRSQWWWMPMNSAKLLLNQALVRPPPPPSNVSDSSAGSGDRREALRRAGTVYCVLNKLFLTNYMAVFQEQSPHVSKQEQLGPVGIDWVSSSLHMIMFFVSKWAKTLCVKSTVPRYKLLAISLSGIFHGEISHSCSEASLSGKYHKNTVILCRWHSACCVLNGGWTNDCLNEFNNGYKYMDCIQWPCM